MTKAELEKKPLSELHSLAADAGVEKYRMLTKAELVEKLAGTDGKEERKERPQRRRRQEAKPARERAPKRAREREPKPAREREPKREREPELEPKPAPAAEAPRPRRRRRRFGRRSKGVTLQTLLLPPEAGRQTLVFAETREGCTALLRSVAADLAADAKGPDPVALLIDPTPEELAEWKRDAPQAEIVSAGQPRHASDALAQAATRAGSGEDVILLVDSLTRLGEATGDAEAAKEFFDAGRAQGSTGGGSLTVVAALERPESV
ncbi:MAG TPA: Rho termination factor N-terminal domain-containing protein [Solirubrobacterales bacterium]|nr:Rho termination factor N-terminal domain-containing protein [Solirubrobacterales bacterium]